MFTAFADTAEYLYAHLAGLGRWTHRMECTAPIVTGRSGTQQDEPRLGCQD